VASYPDLEEVVWVQEEPRNMGAWGYIGRRIVEQLPEGLALAYAGRPRRATPSEGYPQAHQTEQQRLLAEALGLEVPV
jgi:2-oxoglutarate dehydrogenase E1 component